MSPDAACADFLCADEFEPADDWALDRFDPCGLCFPDADSLAEVDVDHDRLLIAVGDESTSLHRRDSDGQASPYFARDQSTLAGRLSQMDPDEIGSGPTVATDGGER